MNAEILEMKLDNNKKGPSSGPGTTATITINFHRTSPFMHSSTPNPSFLPGWVIQFRPFPLIRISTSPCILLADDYLSAADCKALIALAGPEVQRSKVSGGLATANRTSHSMFLLGMFTPLMLFAIHITIPYLQFYIQLELRILKWFETDELQESGAALWLEHLMQDLADTACRALNRPPLILGEATQVIRYERGQHYALHYDNGEEERSGKVPLQRAATIMVYLNDCPAGKTYENSEYKTLNCFHLALHNTI